jgi:hypothetical protein
LSCDVDWDNQYKKGTNKEPLGKPIQVECIASKKNLEVHVYCTEEVYIKWMGELGKTQFQSLQLAFGAPENVIKEYFDITKFDHTNTSDHKKRKIQMRMNRSFNEKGRSTIYKTDNSPNRNAENVWKQTGTRSIRYEYV